MSFDENLNKFHAGAAVWFWDATHPRCNSDPDQTQQPGIFLYYLGNESQYCAVEDELSGEIFDEVLHLHVSLRLPVPLADECQSDTSKPTTK